MGLGTLSLTLLGALVASPPPAVQCGAAPQLPPGRSRVAVQVESPAGQVVEGATVFVSNDPFAQELATDARGLARVSDMPAGEYLVLASIEGGDDQAVVVLESQSQCLVTFVIADQGDTPDPPPGPIVDAEDPLEAGATPVDPETMAMRQRQREKGQTLRGAGIGVLTLGGALVVGSPLSYMIGPCGSDGAVTPDCRGDTRTQLVVGFAVAGGVTMAGGIAMIVVGARQSKRALRVSGLPTRGGAAFSLQGRF